MSTPTAVRRPDTHDMIVVHRVFRRESALMPKLIQAAPDGDTARAQVLADAFGDYQLGLHLHHSGEDELVWPLLLARVDLEADLVRAFGQRQYRRKVSRIRAGLGRS